MNRSPIEEWRAVVRQETDQLGVVFCSVCDLAALTPGATEEESIAAVNEVLDRLRAAVPDRVRHVRAYREKVRAGDVTVVAATDTTEGVH